ncbi:MAG TPA: DsrE family protein, partial [Flavisolibacter sp.]|nr:DsrE family protein [Flavisolibacter sp.]
KSLILLAIVIICFHISDAQPSSQNASDSIAKAQKDSLKMAALFAKAYYPLIKGSKWSGVLPVEGITEIPDPKTRYKLLMEDVFPIKDSIAAKEVNGGLAEVGRIINLHIASGIPKKQLDVVVVVHGPALFALYTNPVYRKKYGIDNPNIAMLDELVKNGVRFIACGQAMNFYDVEKEEIDPRVHISLTAQTVLSGYQLKGYVLYTLRDEK